MVFRPAQSLLTQGIAAQQTQNRWMEKRQTDKRESPLQDVNLEKFWTFVRVAYVEVFCEGIDPHSFLGNGQFKILAFPYIPLVL